MIFDKKSVDLGKNLHFKSDIYGVGNIHNFAPPKLDSFE